MKKIMTALEFDYGVAYDFIIALQEELAAQHHDAEIGCLDYKVVKALAATYELQDYLSNRIAREKTYKEEAPEEYVDCRGVAGGVSMYEIFSMHEGYDDITYAAMELILEKGPDALMYQLNYDDIERVKEFPTIYKRAVELGILKEDDVK